MKLIKATTLNGFNIQIPAYAHTVHLYIVTEYLDRRNDLQWSHQHHFVVSFLVLKL